MKKTLVAVAAMAAVFGAHAEATITGLVETAYNVNKAGKGLGGGQNGGSEIRFGGSEDLGNGLKASFQYTIISDLNTEGQYTSSTVPNGNVTSYNSHIGLSGEFGSLKLGNQFTPIFLAAASTAAWGLAANTGASSMTNPALSTGYMSAVRDNASVTYSSPSISGLTVSAQGDGANNYTSYSVTYSNGAFAAAYGYGRTANGKSANVVGLTFDLGVAKLFANTLNGDLLDNASTTATTKNRAATEVGVSIPFGAASLVASTSQSNAASTKAGSNVGIKYDLSKRTQVYYLNAVQGFGTTSTLTAGTVTNTVGIQHAF